MSINQILEKIKPFYYLLLIIGIASVFFALGRLYGVNSAKESLKIEYTPSGQSAGLILGSSISSSTPEAMTNPGSGEVIGSKTGKKYYFPWCGTVKRIKPENQIKFASIELARASGFTPGGNCKGLK